MDPILVPVTALMIPIIITPTSLWLRHRLKVRQMEHEERLRAMELGVVPQGDRISWPGALVCATLGGGVPVGTLIVTWLATLSNNEIPTEIWFVPVVISLPAVWAAKGLAERMLSPSKGSQAGASARVQADRAAGKSAFDPDAYDVVGSRG